MLAAALGGCATTPSSRLADKVASVRSVWIVVSLGSFDGLSPVVKAARVPGRETSQAMQVRLPETFRRNGVAVSGYRELARPLLQLDELARLWADQRELHGTTSHVLALTAQRLKTQGQALYLEYEAVLWDTATQKLVWKAAPVTALNVFRRSAASGAELLAGDILRVLHRDAIIALPKGYPEGADGLELPVQWHGATL